MRKCNAECWFHLHSNKLRLLSAFVLILICVGSFAGIYKPTSLNVTPKASLDDLSKGRRLYINNCASCHTLYQPEQYDTLQWRQSMEKMAPKAKLSIEDKELIFKYVTKGQ